MVFLDRLIIDQPIFMIINSELDEIEKSYKVDLTSRFGDAPTAIQGIECHRNVAAL